MIMFAFRAAVIAGALSSASAAIGQQGDVKIAETAVQLDQGLPDYTAVAGVSGSIKSIGSDTMNNLMALWAEGFRKLYPNVLVEVEGKGSATAPTALIEGTAQFGPMSRAMKNEEIALFEKKFGYKPTPVVTGIDMLAVYVHKDNPIGSLTLAQVDAIFGKNRKQGHEKDIATWGDLGLTGEWAQKPISLYGRNAASGTYGYFNEQVLKKGDFKDSVKQQPGSSAVVQGVASDRFAIGYSGIGYKTADVRAVPLQKDAKSPVVEAEPENAYNRKYPLTRPLLVYVNKNPSAPLDPLRGEFLRYVLTRPGQAEIVKDGYLPLKKSMAEGELKKLGF